LFTLAQRGLRTLAFGNIIKEDQLSISQRGAEDFHGADGSVFTRDATLAGRNVLALAGCSLHAVVPGVHDFLPVAAVGIGALPPRFGLSDLVKPIPEGLHKPVIHKLDPAAFV